MFQGSLLVAFVCFSVGSKPKYITATVLEFLITSLLLLLYVLKLNKRLTFFFWPLVVGGVSRHNIIMCFFVFIGLVLKRRSAHVDLLTFSL